MILLITFFVPIIYMTMCISILSRVVYEKENKIKETLKMMSMRISVYGISYFIS